MYKILGQNGECYNGGKGTWHLPIKNADGTWEPGEWMLPIDGELVPCENGYHLCRESDLVMWLGPTIYEATHRGELVESDDKVVVREARLLRQCEGWNERTARLFACDCAEHSLHIFEAYCPDDARPRKTIEVARRYANGEATDDELDAARAAAWGAAWAAARDAARAAAGDAARAAAWDAAWDAAWGAERQWQTRHLMKMLVL